MENARTHKTHKKYMHYLANHDVTNNCNLCVKIPIKKFKHWKVVKNTFPYDRIAQTHNMILPNRHICYQDLTKIERMELELIKSKYINKKYEFIMETTDKKKSIPGHFHLHLIVLK